VILVCRPISRQGTKPADGLVNNEAIKAHRRTSKASSRDFGAGKMPDTAIMFANHAAVNRLAGAILARFA